MSNPTQDAIDGILGVLGRELDKGTLDAPLSNPYSQDKEQIETPSWGEEAAAIILNMAEKRAQHIEKFGQSVVNRAQEWNALAHDLASNIRKTAEKEALAIRRETARMLKAGNRIEEAMKEFSPMTQAQEKPNGRDRTAGEAKGSYTADVTKRESVQRAAGYPTGAATGPRQGTSEGAGESAVLKAPEFLQRPFTPSRDDQL